MDKRKCCICGKEDEPYTRRQKTCGSKECKRLQHKEYCEEYKVKNSEKIRKYKRDYNRRQRGDGEPSQPREFQAEGYAERQKQRTLAMVGGVKL